MFYLQEPELGGETVFIDANVVVRPTKGSGLFWYGLYSDGEVDRSTNHGACPVILGRKWVANKWIFYDDQFLARKCGLRPKERYVILANNTSS
ncbi:unnamed protein product [Allacma fusca]|uniref:Prolyl 4-hydroxylase alpha subunit Fe(2+) 2OG dioxygenase domain-containing protein n=1 Tax=Allacma fusca TaxID=39272 RepID=A0A8J2PEN5_9HEXA|nr:unnamed protein product [Allacma fusca]